MTATLDLICPHWAATASEPELAFGQLWVTLYPVVDLYTEAQIIPDRKFRFDFVHYPSKTAIEIQGFGPGHYSIAGVNRDNEKHRLAAENGWLVIPVDSSLVGDEAEHERIKKIIDGRMAK